MTRTPVSLARGNLVSLAPPRTSPHARVDAAHPAVSGHDEADSEDDLDEDAAWVEMTDPTSNDTYYFNSVTQETSWTRPAALGGKRKDEYRVNE